MRLYEIRDWQSIYENNRTRDLKHMAWVPIPNDLDGDGYTLLIEREDGPALFGAWIACVLFDDLGMSHSEIGRILKKHHASVLHALRRSKDLAEVDPQFRSQLCRAREWMRGKIERGAA